MKKRQSNEVKDFHVNLEIKNGYSSQVLYTFNHFFSPVILKLMFSLISPMFNRSQIDCKLAEGGPAGKIRLVLVECSHRLDRPLPHTRGYLV